MIVDQRSLIGGSMAHQAQAISFSAKTYFNVDFSFDMRADGKSRIKADIFQRHVNRDSTFMTSARNVYLFDGSVIIPVNQLHLTRNATFYWGLVHTKSWEIKIEGKKVYLLSPKPGTQKSAVMNCDQKFEATKEYTVQILRENNHRKPFRIFAEIFEHHVDKNPTFFDYADEIYLQTEEEGPMQPISNADNNSRYYWVLLQQEAWTVKVEGKDVYLFRKK